MKQVALDDVVLAVADEGTGPPLVLVHGFPLHHGMWQPQIDGLRDRCRVLAPDLRGFGRSGVTPGTVTMAQFADDLAALLDRLHISEPVVLAGLSMGGYIAWEFFKRHRPRLRGLALLDTRAVADSPEAARGRSLLAQRVLREGTGPLAEMLPRLLGRTTRDENPAVADSVRQMILAADPRGVAAAALGMAARHDAVELLPRIDLPTLVVVGEEDSISTADEMRGMAEAIPGARFVSVPRAGHLTTLEAPHSVNQALEDFLASL